MQYRQQCNSFAPSFEPQRGKLGKTFAGEPETVRLWQTKLSHSKIRANDTACGSSEVAAAGWKEAHTAEHSGCVVQLLLANCNKCCFDRPPF